jgi:hypothetical protein
MGLNWPWTADGAIGPPHFERDFAIDHNAWGVTSQFANFVPNFKLSFPDHSSNILSDPVYYHFSSRILVSCHQFLSGLLCFSERSRPSTSYFRFKIEVFLVDGLYVEAIVAAKSRAALLASLEKWIWIFGDRCSEVRLSNSSQSGSFSTSYKASRVQKAKYYWKVIWL